MAIKKADFKKVKEKFSTSAKYKPQSYFDLGPDFLDAVGVPGPAMGHINMFLGHSDTGKTTALVKTAVDAQRKGILPVFIITEQKWSFEHARLMGFECEEVIDETTGEVDWDGDPDSMIFQSETPPTREMIEEKLWCEIQSFNFKEVELVDAD